MGGIGVWVGEGCEWVWVWLIRCVGVDFGWIWVWVVGIGWDKGVWLAGFGLR